jgi:hypothetical protein
MIAPADPTWTPEKSVFEAWLKTSGSRSSAPTKLVRWAQPIEAHVYSRRRATGDHYGVRTRLVKAAAAEPRS